MTHTPAPWTYEVHQLSEGYSAIVYGANGMRVGTDHLSEDDARLIAAAPAMKEALAAALPYLANHIAMSLDEGPGDRIAYDKAEAALALATGETQC